MKGEGCRIGRATSSRGWRRETEAPETRSRGEAVEALGLLARPGELGLATDLYELTMAAAYFEHGMVDEVAVFEMFVRHLPEDRGYLLVAGLEQAVEYLTRLSFDASSLAYLRRLPIFAAVSDDFFAYLERFRFTGDVNAFPEGTLAFANEPLVQVRAPIIEAQLVETFLLATINHQTLIATKAARVVEAARGTGVIEFGARRAHSFQAACYGARAAVIGGCIGTSNVLAGQRFGLKVYGTAAHSFTMGFPHEMDAFRAFHDTFPQHTILLIDTYDTLEGARRATQVAPDIAGVRLDSGDLLELSRQVRRILDEAGLRQAKIVASGDLNEDKIAALLDAGAPIDLWGVGTDLLTSRDAPALGGVYKLVAVEREGQRVPVRKLSQGKVTYPDAKQVYRARDAAGRFAGDALAIVGEVLPGEPLLVPVLRRGQRADPLPDLPAICARAREQLAALPEPFRRRRGPETYPVSLSPRLQAEAEAMVAGLE
ncbi:MAG: nicotinate phosphoribosyltransferase [Armatimonadetes bacterium]|nr:nicotinate phosphoribosyltransferase [Armatimonadota bacterium]